MLRDRNVRRVVAAHFISRAGGTAGFFVGLWGAAAFTFDATPGSLAALTAIIGVTSLIGAAVAGVLVDRLDPRRVVLLGEAIFVPTILALTLADSVLSLALFAIPAWFAGTLVITAVSSMPPFITPDPTKLERTNALMEGGHNLAFILGPGIGALIVSVWPIDAVFIFDALTSVVAVALVLGVRTRAAAKAERRRGTEELVEGFRYAFTTPPVRFALLVGTVTFLSFGSFTALEPLFFRDVVGADAATLGYVNSVFGIGMVVGAIVLQRLPGRFSSMRAITVLTALGGTGAIAYTSTPRLPIILAGALYWGLVLGLLLPVIRVVLQLHTREGFVGRVMGALGVQHQVGELLPLAVVPVLATAFGVQAVLIGVGGVLITLALVAWPRARALDAALPAPPREATADIVPAVEPVIGEPAR